MWLNEAGKILWVWVRVPFWVYTGDERICSQYCLSKYQMNLGSDKAVKERQTEGSLTKKVTGKAERGIIIS